jgi:hypothetical protein
MAPSARTLNFERSNARGKIHSRPTFTITNVMQSGMSNHQSLLHLVPMSVLLMITTSPFSSISTIFLLFLLPNDRNNLPLFSPIAAIGHLLPMALLDKDSLWHKLQIVQMATSRLVMAMIFVLRQASRTTFHLDSLLRLNLLVSVEVLVAMVEAGVEERSLNKLLYLNLVALVKEPRPVVLAALDHFPLNNLPQLNLAVIVKKRRTMAQVELDLH